MESLHIDPLTLPAQTPGDWDAIFRAGPHPHQLPGHPSESAEVAAAHRHMAGRGDQWVQDFQHLQLNGQAQSWADDFSQQVGPWLLQHEHVHRCLFPVRHGWQACDMMFAWWEDQAGI